MSNTPQSSTPTGKPLLARSATQLQRLSTGAAAVKERIRQMGALGAIKWLLGKVVFYRWSAVVFSVDPLQDRPPSAWPSGYEFSRPAGVADLTISQLNSLTEAGHLELFKQLTPNDEVYWITYGDKVVSVGITMRKSPQCSVLGLPEDAVLIGHCETDVAHRGKGLYALAINDTITSLRLRGDWRIFMETRPDNVASQKGLLKAGLKRERLVQAKIFFRSIVVRQDGMEWIKRP